MEKIKISVVSYLNAKPFLYGLEKGPVHDWIDLSTDTPKECADKLIRNEANLGLIPVVSIREIKDLQIISEFCIGSTGKVGSVLLVSEVPIFEVNTILLDYQSKTSVELVKIIADRLWKIKPVFLQTVPGYEKDIKAATAGVMIGDRALKSGSSFNYVYDLSSCWFDLTGLPFVFACWASNKDLDRQFLIRFEESLAFGVSHIDDLLCDQPELAVSYADASNYLKNQIQYRFDDRKKKALALFLSFLKQ